MLLTKMVTHTQDSKMDFDKKLIRIIKIENLFPESFKEIPVEGDERYTQIIRINDDKMD